MIRIFLCLALWTVPCLANPLEMIHNRSLNFVEQNADVPQKEAVKEVLDRLRDHQCSIEVGGPDLRVKFVGLQGVMEHVLAQLQHEGAISGVRGVIHVPLPATPLCTLPESDPRELMDPVLANDPEKLWTVHSRAILLRQYLLLGAELYSVYPREALNKRSATQREIYLETVRQFENNLHDWPLLVENIAGDMIGATYLFQDSVGESYCFAIKATQVNVPGEEEQWGLWLGRVSDEPVAQRIQLIFEYLKANGGPDLRHPKIPARL